MKVYFIWTKIHFLLPGCRWVDFILDQLYTHLDFIEKVDWIQKCSTIGKVLVSNLANVDANPSTENVT